MLAGGLPQVYGDGYIQNDYNWFYQTLANTHSWSAADRLNVHFHQHQYSRYQLKGSPSQLLGGDVIIFQFPTFQVPTHSRFVVGMGSASSDSRTYAPGTYGLLTNQHSDPKIHIIWDDNLPAGTTHWSWQVIW